MSSKEKILVRGVNWLGDAVMTTPALLRLREAYPESHIALLTAAKLKDLWEGHPAVDQVIPFTAAEGVGAISKRLREEQFTLGLVLPNSLRSAVELWMANLPRRVGYGGRGRGLFLTEMVRRRVAKVVMRKRTEAEVKRLVREQPEKRRDTFPAEAHQVYEYLHLAEALGAKAEPLPPKIAVTEKEAEAFRDKWDVLTDELVGINAGAEYGPAKRWPAERFIEAAKRVNERVGCSWIVFGGAADRALATEIAQELGTVARVINVAGETTLRELCAGLSLCKVVLTNDTGPMHVAAAVGARVVVPFASTSPELTGPVYSGGRQGVLLGRAPCAPCFLRSCPIDFRCMLSIEAGAVSEAVCAALSDRGK